MADVEDIKRIKHDQKSKIKPLDNKWQFEFVNNIIKHNSTKTAEKPVELMAWSTNS